MAGQPLFSNQTRLIDRFGLLTIVTVITIFLLMLVDLDPKLRDTLGRWESFATSALAGITLVLALRASGLRRRWQRVADIIIAVVIAALGATALLQGVIPGLQTAGGPAPLLVVGLSVIARSQ
jgi:hypothetical protein